MKYIKKSLPPSCLSEWIERQTPTGVNLRYDCFPETASLKQALSDEQYGLCGYTGLLLTPDNSCIEHIKPQRICRQEVEQRGYRFGAIAGDDLSYNNMIAAYKQDGAQPFGAAAKGGWYVEDKFVSPLDPSCESRFIYASNGEVFPRENADAAAVTTINAVLRLNHNALVQRRKAVLDIFLLDGSLSLDDLRKISEAMNKPVKGRLNEMAFVICFAIQNHIRIVETNSQ
ncbi:MAG: hypothetical protein NTX50_11820 [Candidatus Sumerlaeota bacterium]|nr:hypothetical protein [Candidatus Sumerlaeota bacterium]